MQSITNHQSPITNPARGTRVLAAGTFDHIHPGHRAYLTEARSLGDELVVVVARDLNVLRHKGRGPRRDEVDRLAGVGALPMVDEAVLGNLDDPLAIVPELKPDVIALGYDQWPNEQQLAKELATRGLADVEIVRLRPFQPNRYKSSKLKPARSQSTARERSRT